MSANNIQPRMTCDFSCTERKSQTVIKRVYDNNVGVITKVDINARIMTNALNKPKLEIGGKLDNANAPKPNARAMDVEKIGIDSSSTVFSSTSFPSCSVLEI